MLLHGILRIVRQLPHDGFRAVAGKVVNPYMQRRVLIGDAPFDRDGNTARLRKDAQQHRRFDAVVIRERNHASEAEPTLDLVTLELKGRERRKRGRPVRPAEIDCNRGLGLGPPLLRSQREPEDRVPSGVVANEVEPLS